MINPFYISVASFITVILTFSLRWSELYQHLDIKIFLFFLVNSCFSLLLGFVFKKDLKFKNKTIRNKRINVIVALIFVGYLINFIYSREIPILNVLLGSGSYYKEIIMIPTFYPLLTAINVFFIIDIFYQYLSFNNKRDLYSAIILLTPFLINMGRGIFIMAVLPCALLYASSKKDKINISLKNSAKLIIILLAVLYAFGYLGDIRNESTIINQSKISEHTEKNEIILNLGGSTEKFRESIIPKEYFWTYLYIASPIANLNRTINSPTIGANLKDFIVYNFLPQSIQNRLIDMNEFDNSRRMYLVNETFNVCTAYAFPYFQRGWLGLLGYQVIYYILFFVGFLIVRKSSYKTIFLSLYSSVGALSFFSNILWLDVVTIPIILCVLLGLINRGKQTKEKV